MSNIFITGFSGSGKTTVGKKVALLLGWSFVDTDDEIVKTTGSSINAIFTDRGEPYFRCIESKALADVLSKQEQVVSTGGGIVVSDLNRKLMRERGLVFHLEALPETIQCRIKRQNPGNDDSVLRPKLNVQEPGDELLTQIRSLKETRQSAYALADWTIHTDRLSPDEVAQQIVSGWKMLNKLTSQHLEEDKDLAYLVTTSSGNYPVWVGAGIIETIGERTKKLVDPGTAYIVTDEGVYKHARRAQISMEKARIPTHMFVVPQGESMKSIEMTKGIYEWLANKGAERGHMILSIGGGVVGDLSGFVASTFLRGIPFAQVPTSMLAMMDASIGGKTAIDLPKGKNLVGAFYQPRFVLTDVEVLNTLPRRELISGWAEAIKHAIIMDEDLLEMFESSIEPIKALDPKIVRDVIHRSVAIKAEVVSTDERETLGRRVLLNYGHTIGHAIEAATNYTGILHGEAVSVGMMGAGYMSMKLGMLTKKELNRQRDLLQAIGLPMTYPGVDRIALMDAMRSDKKTSSGTIRWVLLEGIGKAVTRSDVPAKLVQETINQLTR